MRNVFVFVSLALADYTWILAIAYLQLQTYTYNFTCIFQLVILVLIRKIVMERIFTHKELCALDDPLPSWREMLRSKKVSQRYPKISINAVADEKVHLQKLN